MLKISIRVLKDCESLLLYKNLISYQVATRTCLQFKKKNNTSTLLFVYVQCCMPTATGPKLQQVNKYFLQLNSCSMYDSYSARITRRFTAALNLTYLIVFDFGVLNWLGNRWHAGNIVSEGSGECPEPKSASE